MLLDGDGVVGAAFDRCVIRHDERFAAGNASDAGDQPGARCVVVVQIPGCQRGQLEKRRAGIEQPLDPLAGRQLALIAVALASVNIFGGFAVTERMLAMYKKKERKG